MDVKEIEWGYGLDSSGSWYGAIVNSFEDSNKSWFSIKCWKFLERMSDCRLLKDSAP
jgi:hypothetical protein